MTRDELLAFAEKADKISAEILDPKVFNPRSLHRSVSDLYLAIGKLCRHMAEEPEYKYTSSLGGKLTTRTLK